MVYSGNATFMAPANLKGYLEILRKMLLFFLVVTKLKFDTILVISVIFMKIHLQLNYLNMKPGNSGKQTDMLFQK